MLFEEHKEKEMTRAEALKKVEAYKTINEFLANSSKEFMNNLKTILKNKLVEQENLKAKLESGTGTEKDNAEYLFIGGYVQALQDITSCKKD